MRLAIALALSGVLLVACQIVAPDDPSGIQPAIILSASGEFTDIVGDVDGVALRVTKPSGALRDTVLTPRVRDDGLRVRAVLRPDEGRPGTTVTITLKAQRDSLFTGTTVLGTDTGWPQEARITVRPIATLDIGADRNITIADSMALDRLQGLVFRHGRTVASTEITWTSLSPSIIEIDAYRATPRDLGVAQLVAAWNGQVDTMAVEVFPVGTIVLAEDSVLHYVGPEELLVDRVTVSNEVVGDAGVLSASVAPGFPWLRATLSDSTAPTVLNVEMDGRLLPGGGEVGRVVVSSETQGVDDVVLVVDARGEPSTGVEEARWNPLCVIGDSISSELAGIVGCVDLRARAWNEGELRRVVLEVDNLQGSRGDSLDTAEHFEIYGIGVQVTLNAPVELLDVRTTGAVDILGQPSFEHSRFGGLQIQESATGSRITGCAGPAFWNIAYRMCDPEGFTGAVRIDFQVADTTWSLLDKAARLNVTMRPGGSVSCPSGSRVCFVVR